MNRGDWLLVAIATLIILVVLFEALGELRRRRRRDRMEGEHLRQFARWVDLEPLEGESDESLRNRLHDHLSKIPGRPS